MTSAHFARTVRLGQAAKWEGVGGTAVCLPWATCSRTGVPSASPGRKEAALGHLHGMPGLSSWLLAAGVGIW